MSFGGDEGESVGFATAHGRDWPSVRQFNVFLANRLAALMNAVRRFETTDNRIIALSVVDSTDLAIVRLVLGDPERAYEVFEQANLPFTESDLLVVMLPDGPQPLVQICKALWGGDQHPLCISADGGSRGSGLCRSARGRHRNRIAASRTKGLRVSRKTISMTAIPSRERERGPQLHNRDNGREPQWKSFFAPSIPGPCCREK